MTIFPRSVGLPDVDACMRHRRSRTGEHTSPDMDELALRLSGAAAWTRQIGCQIGALRDRIERADNLRRRDRQCCCLAATRLGFGCGLAHQGSLISASLTILAQWAMSVRIPSPNSAAVPPTATAPILSSEARIFGSARTLLIALLSCDVIRNATTSELDPKRTWLQSLCVSRSNVFIIATTARRGEALSVDQDKEQD